MGSISLRNLNGDDVDPLIDDLRFVLDLRCGGAVPNLRLGAY
jgi:hypothetical protein